MTAAIASIDEHTVAKAYALADCIFETGEDGHSYIPYMDFRDRINQIKTYAEAVDFAASFIEDTFDSAVDAKVDAGLLSEANAEFIGLHDDLIKKSGGATLGAEVFHQTRIVQIDDGGRVLAPTPDHVKRGRAEAGLTAQQAGELVHKNYRAWQRWEAGTPMATALWELFCIKTGLVTEK